MHHLYEKFEFVKQIVLGDVKFRKNHKKKKKDHFYILNKNLKFKI